MLQVLLLLLTFTCLAMLLWGASRPERMFQFPCLAGATFGGYVLPQFFALSYQDDIPIGGLQHSLIMAILCVAASFFAYTMTNRPILLGATWRFDERRLAMAALVMSLAGMFFFYQVTQLLPDAIAEHGQQLSGPITIYMFFSSLLTIGAAIAIVLHLRHPNPATYAVLAMATTMYAHRILIGGRRGAMAQLFIIVILAIWFQRRWSPPRLSIVILIACGIFLVNSAADYRTVVRGKDGVSWSGKGVSSVASIDFVGNMKDRFTGNASDVRNTVYAIHATSRTLKFDYGLSLYNAFISQYVPGQIVGYDVKRELKITSSTKNTNTLAELGHTQRVGSTFTGLVDAYQSFWYFGAIKFALIGYIVKRLFVSGERGSIVAQLVVMLVLTDALHAFTHSTHRFFLQFVALTAFLIPALVLSRSKGQTCLAVGNAKTLNANL